MGWGVGHVVGFAMLVAGVSTNVCVGGFGCVWACVWGFSTVGCGDVARAFSMAILRASISSSDSFGSSSGVVGGMGDLISRSLPLRVVAISRFASVFNPLEDGGVCVGLSEVAVLTWSSIGLRSITFRERAGEFGPYLVGGGLMMFAWGPACACAGCAAWLYALMRPSNILIASVRRAVTFSSTCAVDASIFASRRASTVWSNVTSPSLEVAGVPS